jgi:hypothetical protein
MIVTDKNIKSLINKIQKKCKIKANKIRPLTHVEDLSRFEKDSSTDMFDEMKKLPFKE